MKRVSVLCVLLLLCSLSGAELQDNEIIERTKVSPESVNAPEQSQHSLSDLHVLLHEISVKVGALQFQVDQMQAFNEALFIKVNDIEKSANEVEILKRQQQEQSSKLRDLQTNEVNPIKEHLRGQTAALERLKARSNVTENHVASLRRDRAAGQVAFSASLVASGAVTLGPYNTQAHVVFRHVVTNIGNAYNPSTGFFIAPVRGAYHFEFYIMGPMDNSGRITGARLVKNGANVIAAYESQASGWGSASDGVTLLLEKGDTMFVRLWQGTRIYDDGDHFSTFSGHLLFPL